MENRAENGEAEELEPVTEWEKPTVTEFDVSSTTLAGVGVNSDGTMQTYS